MPKTERVNVCELTGFYSIVDASWLLMMRIVDAPMAPYDADRVKLLRFSRLENHVLSR